MNERPVLLLIEDNPGDAGLATEAADWLGLDADIAWVNDGAEAIEWLRRRHVDQGRPCPRLIVLDLNLPKMDGHEFLDRLRSGKTCEQVRVVVLSSSNRDQDRSRATHFGVRRYVVKPRVWHEYLDAFREVADEWRSAAG
jgi:CheY-like chemotaxis protein